MTASNNRSPGPQGLRMRLAWTFVSQVQHNWFLIWIFPLLLPIMLPKGSWLLDHRSAGALT